MSEGTVSSTGKRRIETLSDLIFGLALSIGALTLIGQQPNNFTGLVLAVLYYAFSFAILIGVWLSYTQIMSHLRIETRRATNLNIFLLFLVSIEPFLFNQLLHNQGILVQDVSILYALDLGGLFTVQAFLAGSILAEKNQPVELIRYYTITRNSLILGAIIFFVSTLPFFWTWLVIINGVVSIPIRFLIWLVPLIIRSIRQLYFERMGKQLKTTSNLG